MNYIDEWRSEEKMKSTNDLVNYRNQGKQRQEWNKMEFML